MKLAIILSTNNPETNWNALRLANLAITKGDEVSIFLLGEGVEYEKNSSDKFNINQQVETFLKSNKAQILACGTCLKLRNQPGSETCPISGLKELYELVDTKDKVLTF
jgi:sulfur relay (sulfurtransferase) complex TusBCD TusD component (DsrE family)